MKKILITLFVLSVGARAFAQTPEPSPVTISGYVEAYYVYDFNQPVNNTRPGFIYSYNRHNEVNLNLGFVKAAYATDQVRANLALMAGTYANANLAAEPGVLKNVLEANAGVRLSKTKNLWIDAGIFGSHIGFESAIGKDCWNLTRSILADNTPYYEAGAKISYTSNDGKWFLSGMVLNGWQRIQRIDGNSLPSFGTQVTFKPTASVTLNSSSFIGTDKPDSVRQMRYFHNFYGIFQVSSRLGVTVGFDLGAEEESPEASLMSTWYSPVVVVRYHATDKVTLAVRGEYYSDAHGVILSTGTPNGFKTSGVSFNVDYAVSPAVVWRTEIRTFNSKDDVFIKNEDQAVNTNTFVGTSLAVSF